MQIKNRLSETLRAFGIESMTPTATLLKNLGGMTRHRFNQILNNASKTELSVLEVSLIQDWLGGITGKEPASIEVLVAKEEKKPTPVENQPAALAAHSH
jgi:hypothetical protein